MNVSEKTVEVVSEEGQFQKLSSVCMSSDCGLFLFTFEIYVYVCVCHTCAGVPRGQERVSGPLELELQVLMGCPFVVAGRGTWVLF